MWMFRQGLALGMLSNSLNGMRTCQLMFGITDGKCPFNQYTQAKGISLSEGSVHAWMSKALAILLLCLQKHYKKLSSCNTK